MKIEFDPFKRQSILEGRGLDLADAAAVFEGDTITIQDDRKAYGEHRFITIGFLKGRMIVMVWTPRGDVRRIISLRKANDRKHSLYYPRFGR